MNAWVLIIAMYSPGGDFMDKRHLVLPDQKACVQAKAQIEKTESPMGVKVKGLCVTQAHWEGKKQMKGVDYD